jgi:hypothetical protein
MCSEATDVLWLIPRPLHGRPVGGAILVALVLGALVGSAFASASGRSELGGEQQRKPFSAGNCTTASCPTKGSLDSMARRSSC